MKNCWIIVMLISLVSCIGNPNPAQRDNVNAKDMPSFDIMLKDTVTKFNTSKIPKGEPVVLFFFGTDCPYCQKLTEEIIQRIDEFKDIRFYMVSAARFHDIQLYDERYNLAKYNNITIGQDVKATFFTYYRAPGYPYLVVYNKQKQLSQIIIGGVTADSLKTVINKAI